MFETTDPQMAVLLSDGLYFLCIGAVLLMGYWYLKVSRRKKENMQKVGAELHRILSDSKEGEPPPHKEDKDSSTLF